MKKQRLNSSKDNAAKLLEKAQNSLEIEHISLRDTHFTLHPAFIPDVLHTVTADAQFRGTLVSCSTINLDEIKDDDAIASRLKRRDKLVSYQYLFGVRLINQTPGQDNEELLKLECTFGAIYSYVKDAKELDENTLKVFGEHNVPYNLWAFWRETAHSFTQRLGMPGLVIPLFKPSL